MFLSWGTWPMGQNVVLKFSCSRNGSQLAWSGKEVFPLKSVRLRASRCHGVMRIHDRDGWEEMPDAPNCKPCTRVSETVKTEKWIFLTHKQLLFRDIQNSCWIKPIVRYLQNIRHVTTSFIDGKTPPWREQHVHVYSCGLRISKEVWSSPACWPWVLPFSTRVSPGRCSLCLVHSGSWRRLSSCPIPSTFLSTGFLHSFCQR